MRKETWTHLFHFCYFLFPIFGLVMSKMQFVSVICIPSFCGKFVFLSSWEKALLHWSLSTLQLLNCKRILLQENASQEDITLLKRLTNERTWEDSIFEKSIQLLNNFYNTPKSLVLPEKSQIAPKKWFGKFSTTKAVGGFGLPSVLSYEKYHRRGGQTQ